VLSGRASKLSQRWVGLSIRQVGESQTSVAVCIDKPIARADRM
jgi:hypothetical protein